MPDQPAPRPAQPDPDKGLASGDTEAARDADVNELLDAAEAALREVEGQIDESPANRPDSDEIPLHEGLDSPPDPEDVDRALDELDEQASRLDLALDDAAPAEPDRAEELAPADDSAVQPFDPAELNDLLENIGEDADSDPALEEAAPPAAEVAVETEATPAEAPPAAAAPEPDVDSLLESLAGDLDEPEPVEPVQPAQSADQEPISAAALDAEISGRDETPDPAQGPCDPAASQTAAPADQIAPESPTDIPLSDLPLPARPLVAMLRAANSPFGFVPNETRDLLGLVAVITTILSVLAAAVLLFLL